MSNKKITSIIIKVLIIVIIIICLNNIATKLIENTNIVCPGQTFLSPEEAIQAMEKEERQHNDPSLDYCPPYTVKYTFDYKENTIVFYSYCRDFDGDLSSRYAVKILKHNADHSLSFDSGFADFRLTLPSDSYDYDYYYFTNIHTSTGTKSISFLYLPQNSDKDIFVDGKKATKKLVCIDNQNFYICYAISSRDSFLSNLFTRIKNRHTVEIK